MSNRQLELLTFIRNSIVHENRIPTYREMKNFMGVTSNKTLEEMIFALIRDGYLEKNKEKFRGVRLTPKAMMLETQVFFGKNQEDIPDNSIHSPNNAAKINLQYTPNNTATHIFQSTPLANGIITQPNGFISWKGGEKKGTK